MATVKIIRTDREYTAALSRVKQIFDAEEGTPESNELDVLSLLVEDYERRKFIFSVPDPVDAIQFRLKQMGKMSRDLIPILGGSGKVSEVMTGKRPLSLAMIRALNQHLGISADVLIRDRSKAGGWESGRIDYKSFPVSRMLKLNWLQRPKGTRGSTEELIQGLIRAAVGEGALPQPHFRKNDQNRLNAKTDPSALQAWCLFVLSEARKRQLKAKYLPGTINLKVMQRLSRLSNLEQGPKLAQEYLSDYGIALVIANHLPRTHLDGAAMKTTDGTPVIGMTLRYDRLDNFWFCLMHEIAHVARHLDNADMAIFVDDLTLMEGNKFEEEADEWAEEALLPRSAWKASGLELDASEQRVVSVARQFGVSPAIVAGRVRHVKQNYRLLTKYVGQGEVRKWFPEEYVS